MTKVKKMLGVLLAAMLCFAFTPIAAFADGSSTLTITDPVQGHTYKIYQMLKGDIKVADGSLVLDSSTDGKSTLSNVEPGYNLSKDVTVNEAFLLDIAGKSGNELGKYMNGIKAGDPLYTLPDDGKNSISVENGYYLIDDEGTGEDPVSAFMVAVAGNTTIKPKTSTIEFDKSIVESGENVDVNSAAIGGTVSYELTVTLGDISRYDNYKVEFVDTLSKGLTAKQDTIKLYKGSQEIAGELYETDVKVNENGTTSIDVTVSDVKVEGINAVNGDEIILKYDAEVNEEAVIGDPGNPNEAYVKYSNNPNTGEFGGVTPPDKVKTYVTEININKVDQDNNALKGARFELLKKDAAGEYVSLGNYLVDDAAKLTFTGLEEGYYKLVETATPDGYNTIDPVEFQITLTVSGEGADATGAFGIEYLNEDGEVVEAPTGWTFNIANNTYNTTVVNVSGVELPSTGGIGTTIFYIVGGILVVGAVAFLIVRRRANSTK